MGVSHAYHNETDSNGRYPKNEVNSLSYHDFESAKNQKRLHRLESVSDNTSRKISSTSSLSRMSTSSQSPPTSAENKNAQQKLGNDKSKTNTVSEVPLITPESIGLVFNQANGLWQEPESQNHDITNSHTVENTTSNTSTQNTEEYSLDSEVIHNNRFQIQKKNHRRGINSKILRSSDISNTAKESPTIEEFKETKLDEQDESGFISDDTSLTPPKIDRKYIIEHKDYLQTGILTETSSRKRNKGHNFNDQLSPIKETIHSRYDGNTTPPEAADITSVSQFEGNTSFHENKINLLSILTEVVNHEADWTKVRSIDLKGQHLLNVNQLDDFLPSLLEIDVSNNYLNSLNGLPLCIMNINASKNDITNAFLLLQDLIHVEVVNFSNNKINSMHQTFDSLPHLKKLILSNNEIKLLCGIENVYSLVELNLSSNLLEGTLDFATIRENMANPPTAG
ncbi:hypothetical protein RNJ44_03976 [Nakaseomyces bracarensis]|uniref:Uncharacterized protein n=1 Tax=Nakaseomyces bracarensis TaxID=273131 RepID=A0ABR4NYG7_9SACH